MCVQDTTPSVHLCPFCFCEVVNDGAGHEVKYPVDSILVSFRQSKSVCPVVLTQLSGHLIDMFHHHVYELIALFSLSLSDCTLSFSLLHPVHVFSFSLLPSACNVSSLVRNHVQLTPGIKKLVNSVHV